MVHCFFVKVVAQEANVFSQDSVVWSDENPVVFSPPPIRVDTVRSLSKGEFRPDPNKACIFAAIFPGLGHIYNRKYWKLPLIYGGFLGCMYAVTWNNTQYVGYRNAYSDIQPVDATGNESRGHSWINYVPFSWGKPEQLGDLTPDRQKQLTTRLKNARDYFRRNRDLSIIVSVGVYALSVLDAYVDARLFDFDISPDLSMRVKPAVFQQTMANSSGLGLQLNFNFQ